MVQPNIKAWGNIPYSELKKIYKEIDCVVCASREETLSATIVEGMSGGKVCITTSNSGVAEYIHDGQNGFVFKNEDPGDLAKKMNYVYSNLKYLDYIKKNARLTFEKEFSIEALKMRLRNEINRIL